MPFISISGPNITNQGFLGRTQGGYTSSKKATAPRMTSLTGGILNSGATLSGESVSSSYSGIDRSFLPEFDARFAKAEQAADQAMSNANSTATTQLDSIAAAYNRAMENLQGVGGYESERINRESLARSGSVGASMAGTGLYNSTVMPTLRQGVERDRLEAIGQLEASIRDQKIGLEMNRVQSEGDIRSSLMSALATLGGQKASLLGQKAVGPQKSSSSSTSRQYTY